MVASGIAIVRGHFFPLSSLPFHGLYTWESKYLKEREKEKTQILGKYKRKRPDILRAAGRRQLDGPRGPVSSSLCVSRAPMVDVLSNWLRQLHGAALRRSGGTWKFFGESMTGVTFVPLGLTPIETCQLPHQRRNRAAAAPATEQRNCFTKKTNKQWLLCRRALISGRKKKKNSNTSLWSRTKRMTISRTWNQQSDTAFSACWPLPFFLLLRNISLCTTVLLLLLHIARFFSLSLSVSPFIPPVFSVTRIVRVVDGVGRRSSTECYSNDRTS